MFIFFTIFKFDDTGFCRKDKDMKQCNRCKKNKELEEFHKDNKSKDGRKTICKECRSNKKIRKRITKSHKKLDRSISRSIYFSIKRNKSGYIWEKIININLSELKNHLENQFDDIMSWNNYGSYWVIDKIIPTSFYNYSDRINNEFYKAWSLKNLRPYPKHLHNIRKQKIMWELIDNYSLYDILPIGIIGDNLWKEKNF